MVKIASHDDGQCLEDIVFRDSSSLSGQRVNMNNAQSSKWSLSQVMVTIIAGLLSMSSCSGGGGGVWPAVVQDSSGVSIDVTKLPNYPGYYVQTSSIDLVGDAPCDNCPSSIGGCNGPLFPETAITIAWTNLSSGASGTGYYDIMGMCVCFSGSCWINYYHGWIAPDIPLELGENVIKVTASNASGWSGGTSITITRLPETPGGFMATAGAGQIMLNWNAVLDATSYNLYWSTSSNFTKDTATKIENVSSPYTHSGLSNDVTYYYYVTAVIGNYESAVSSYVFATTGWHTETLVSLPSEVLYNEVLYANPAIAVGSSGNIHIFYVNLVSSYDSGWGTTDHYFGSYLSNASGTWVSVPVASPWGIDANIAVDSLETVHISYMKSGSGAVHAIYTAGSWSSEVIDSLGAGISSFVLDSTNKPHIAYTAGYYDNGTAAWVYELRYATKTSGTWTSSTVPVPEGCGGDLSLAVDKNGVAHIAFSCYGVFYATNQGGTWAISTIEKDYSYEPSIAVDSNGKVHIAYDGHWQLKYAHNMLGTWTVDVIDEKQPYNISLGLNAAGKAHISYASENPSRLQYATNLSGTWNICSIDAVPSAAYSRNSIALDSQGKVYIVYYYGSIFHPDGDHIIKYATNK